MTFALFLLFTLIGVGPALAIRKAQIADCRSWLLAPAVGFVVIAIVVTVLVDCQMPIERFALISAIAAVVASVALVAWVVLRNRNELGTTGQQEESSEWTWGVLTIVVGAILIGLPVQLGGRWFNHFRGNGWDSYNYVTGAGGLVHEPIKFFRNSDDAALLARQSSYLNAQKLLKERWTTEALLGWSSCVFGDVPLFDIEPSFGAMHLLLALGPAFVLARNLRVGVRWAAVIAILVNAGFWAQFTLDLRSLSQLNSWPILLLLLAVWPEVARRTSWHPFLPERLLVTLGACALALCYVELVPMVALGLGVGLALRWYLNRESVGKVASEYLPVVVGLVAAAIMVPLLLGFLTRQANLVTATNKTANWVGTQHGWLVSHPYVGFWGLSHLDAGVAGWWTSGLALLTALVACVLTAMLLMQLASVVMDDASPVGAAQVSNQMLAGLLIAGILQAGGLLTIGQYWGTVKAVGYVAPLCLFACVAWWVGRGAWGGIGPGRAVLSGAVGFLVLSQGWAALLRIVLVERRSDYLQYIYYLPNYGARDLDIAPIRAALSKQKETGLRVGLMIPDMWLSRMVRLELGWDYKLQEPLGVIDVDEHTRALPPLREGKIDYWVWQKESLPANVPSDAVVARTGDLVLTRSFPFVIDINNPNGVEEDAGTGLPLTWLGTEPALFRVNSPGAGQAFLAARYIPGPSLPGTADRHLEVMSDASTGAQTIVVNGGTQQVPFAVKEGINTLRLQCVDRPQPVELNNGDQRALLLEIVGPRVEMSR